MSQESELGGLGRQDGFDFAAAPVDGAYVLLTAGTGGQTEISSLRVVNISLAPQTFGLVLVADSSVDYNLGRALVPDGTQIESKDFFYDCTGILLSPGNQIKFKPGSGDLTALNASAFGKLLK